MTDPIEISRRIRRGVDRDGLSANVVADLNIAVSTGGPAAADQDAPIRQGRSSRAASDGPDAKENT